VISNTQHRGIKLEKRVSYPALGVFAEG